jgi:DNA-binding NarL/FixJ family response regulator
MDNPTTVTIVDDHPIFRKGLRDVIGQDAQYQIVGEAENGEAALHQILDLKPVIAIVDIDMPKMNGFELVKALMTHNALVDIIFLTMYKEQDLFNEAMDLGVKGYVLKENAVKDILESIRIVASGKYYISPMLSSYLIQRNNTLKEFHGKYPSMIFLTPTEKKILKLIGENKTSKEIAEILFISGKTVENHRLNIAKKLDLHGSHQLLRFALENKANF